MKAVLFDAGYTLIGVQPSVGEVYGRVARRHGVEIATQALDSMFAQVWKAHRADDLRTDDAQERAWWAAIVGNVFATLGVRDAFTRGFDAFFADLYDVFATTEAWSVYDDVLHTLDQLDALGVRRAIVSNADSRMHGLLEGFGIRSRVEFTLISAEAGYRKPHAAIFELALQRLGLPAEDVLFVGDSHEDDYLGAHAVGMRAVLVARSGGNEDSGAIMSLTDIIPLCRNTSG